ncbi:MAG: hypothetical protein K1X67_19960 [Fimbriimonadaceae bacterium]|nr:hypothetical protein [Fimbriimonadaceae bacterium]
MKHWLWALLLALTALSGAQTSEEKIEAALNSVPSQAVVTVRKHAMGADMVEITMLDPKYPLDLLRGQIERIGQFTGAGARGVKVGKTAQSDKGFVKATFATNNIIEDETGKFRLEPFARAFAGAPKPYTISAFLVSFEEQRPTEKSVKTYRSDAVALAGRAIPPPFGGLEYRVVLFTQDPDAIAIPDEHKEPAPVVKKAVTPPPKSNQNTLTIVLIAVAALAAGALVYFLTRPRGPVPNPSRREP